MLNKAVRLGNPRPDVAELTPVDPREVWVMEVSFSQWLSENLGRLSQLIGLDLELVEREGSIGKYFADIVAREVGGGRTVIIENQFGMTDHDHLGKLLTYSAGRKADISIWIAPSFSDPHRATLEWLNEVSLETQLFFGISLHVVQVDASRPAVKLELVVKPNAYLKRESTARTSPKTERYRAFFSDLIEKVQLAMPDLTKASKGYPQSWFFFRTGRSGLFYCVEFVLGTKLRVSVYTWTNDRDVNKRYFDLLHEQSAAIEAELGEPLSWERRDDLKTSVIGIYHSASIEDPPEALATARDWAITTLGRFRAVLGPRLEALPRLQPAVPVAHSDSEAALEPAE